MSCTPDFPKITNKASHVGGSINKNLLTPCRRIGLSRKRPSSTVKNCTDSSPISNNDCLVIQTTPVNHKNCIKRKTYARSPIIFEDTSAEIDASAEKEEKVKLKRYDNNASSIEKKSSKDLLKSYSDDLFDGSDALFVNIEDTEPSMMPQTISDMVVTRTKTFLDQSRLGTKLNYAVNPTTLQDNLIKLPNTDLLVTNDSESDATSHKINLLDKYIDQRSDSDEEFTIDHKSSANHKKVDNKVLKQKSIKKTFSLKKSLVSNSSSLSDDEFDTIIPNQATNSFEGCRIQLQRISKDKIHVSNKNLSITHESCNKLIDIVIDEEEDAFTSTPKQEKTNKINILQQVEMLEKVVKQKQVQLADLKQASIYKNKHNIEDIRQLTSKWITGCVSGLNDLLIQLQAHGPIGMTTLLNNLHIPSDIVTKLFPNID